MTKPHIFAGSPLDRAAHLRTDAEWLASALADAKNRLVPIWDLKALVALGEPPSIDWRPATDLAKLAGEEAEPIFLGLGDHERAHFAIGLAGEDNPAKDGGPLAGTGKFIDVRSIAPQIAGPEAAILAQARHLIDWHRRHKFCANCGAETSMIEAGYSRKCPDEDCKTRHFPRTDPVVIMLVLKDGRCMLGRQPWWPDGMYSALAGFVEPGETIEEAVRREVKEEAGIETGDVHYHSSQPWPFPASIMIGCMAEALTDEVHIDGNELQEARWFDRDEIAEMIEAWHNMRAPRTPPPMSIAHQLCRAWLRGG
jgi:NAD+ diphosphatase